MKDCLPLSVIREMQNNTTYLESFIPTQLTKILESNQELASFWNSGTQRLLTGVRIGMATLKFIGLILYS